MAATASQTNLAGLPRRLVQDGIVGADALAEASEAAKKQKLPLVAYLVNEELAEARELLFKEYRPDHFEGPKGYARLPRQ